MSCRRVTEERATVRAEQVVGDRWRILVIDDDRRFQLALATALEHRAVVRTADTVEAAHRLLDAWRPHAVVIDPAVRTGDGFELLAACITRRHLRVFCCLPTRFATALTLGLPTVIFVDRNSPIRSLAHTISAKLSHWHSGTVLSAPRARHEIRHSAVPFTDGYSQIPGPSISAYRSVSETARSQRASAMPHGDTGGHGQQGPFRSTGEETRYGVPGNSCERRASDAIEDVMVTRSNDRERHQARVTDAEDV